MHVGIAYLRWRGKRSRHSRRMRTRNFVYLARGTWKAVFLCTGIQPEIMKYKMRILSVRLRILVLCAASMLAGCFDYGWMFWFWTLVCCVQNVKAMLKICTMLEYVASMLAGCFDFVLLFFRFWNLFVVLVLQLFFVLNTTVVFHFRIMVWCFASMSAACFEFSWLVLFSSCVLNAKIMFQFRIIVSRQWDSWPCPKNSLWIGVVALEYFDRI